MSCHVMRKFGKGFIRVCTSIILYTNIFCEIRNYREYAIKGFLVYTLVEVKRELQSAGLSVAIHRF